MASRFHQRDTNRSSLFSSYDAQSRPRPSSAAPAPYRTPTPNGNTYAPSGSPFAAYPHNNNNETDRPRSTGPDKSVRPYNTAVLDELESQNDVQVGEMSRRVAMLKDITLRIGDEIRDSTALAEKMNDQFGNAGNRLKGTMRRMLRMAERTGVGWRVWLGFFAAVIVLFWYVWLF
ncbi:hypothetical protein ANO11243_040900 [Dothideomycetidae sp. 11243]|nr:hypothetical protein ANO11243_040900 [fungal sp. No.11243]